MPPPVVAQNTAIVANTNPERRSRFAVRWLRRLLEEDQGLTIEEAIKAD